MPNTPEKRSGASLRQRAAVARQMTAEQQRAARQTPYVSRHRAAKESEAAQDDGSARRSRKRAAVQKDAEQGASKKFKKRTAKGEHVEKPARTSWRPSLPEFNLKFGTVVAIVVVCVLAASLVILYPAGQTYYQALRDEQRAQAVLDAVSDRNAAIEKSNEELQTDEGIENEARTRDGLVKEGEVSVVVTNADDSKEGSSALPEQVDSDAITAPNTWYYTLLDGLFLYDNSPKNAK